MVQGRATTTKMKRGAVAKRRTARFELKMVSHYYTLRMYVTTVFWNNGQTQMLTLNRNYFVLNIGTLIKDTFMALKKAVAKQKEVVTYFL